MPRRPEVASVLRLEEEIAKGRLRLSLRLEELGLGDSTAAPAKETAKGRLYRVFSLVAEY